MIRNVDHIIRIVMIGDSFVGKSNIIKRFCQNKFISQSMSSIGVDFKQKIIEIQDQKISVQLWDTAGQQRFRSLTPSLYKGAMGIIIVFSLTSRQSFQSIDMWIKQINDYTQQNLPKILLGNKSDLQNNRKVTKLQCRKMAQLYGIDYYQCSAKNDQNIRMPIYTLCNQIKDKLQTIPFQVNRQAKNKKCFC